MWGDDNVTDFSTITEEGLEYLSAVFLADEDDVHVDSNLRSILHQALAIQNKSPGVLTYQGGHVNRFNGLFSGITDIQGMDFYIAACAPMIISETSPLPLQGSYAYLRNTRNNMMPLPTMSYAQIYGPMWSYQPRLFISK